MFALFIVIILAALANPFTASAQEFDSAAEERLVNLVNRERVKAGLPELALDERLAGVARQHSSMMAEKRAIAHQFEGELGVKQRVATTTLHFNYSGENVALDSDIEQAHVGLMNSPPHRHNLLSPDYNAIGVGVVRSGSTIYVTEDFANRLPELSVDGAEKRIAAAFTELREGVRAHPLPLIPRPGLRQMACEMAATDNLSTQAATRIPNASNVVVYTATEIDKLPGNMHRLKNENASGYSLGVCFSKSASYSNAVYWVVVVTYY